MKRPSFQFYPADWRKDANLRRCSPAARGVWMDVLCLLHDSDEYGIVRWPLKDVASAAGASISHLRELADKRVLKGTDKGNCGALIYTPRHGRREGPSVTLIAEQEGPIWYSARFVRDEYVRTIRGESTRFGDADGDAPKDPPNTPPNHSPKPPFGDGSSSSSSSSPSGNTDSEGKPSDGKPSAAAPVGELPGITPAPTAPPSDADPVKTEIWRTGRKLLTDADVSKNQAGTFLGKLVTDYGQPIVLDAVRAAAKAAPPEPREYLKATCQRLAGERKRQAEGTDWTGDAE